MEFRYRPRCHYKRPKYRYITGDFLPEAAANLAAAFRPRYLLFLTLFAAPFIDRPA